MSCHTNVSNASYVYFVNWLSRLGLLIAGICLAVTDRECINLALNNISSTTPVLTETWHQFLLARSVPTYYTFSLSPFCVKSFSFTPCKNKLSKFLPYDEFLPVKKFFTTPCPSTMPTKASAQFPNRTTGGIQPYREPDLRLVRFRDLPCR